MEVATNEAWFNHAGTLGTIGLVGAFICAVLAIIFLIKQYRGQEKASVMTRLFLILGIVFLLVARFAPQENEALSHMHDESTAGFLEHGADAVLNEGRHELDEAHKGLEKLDGAVEEFGKSIEDDAGTILDEDNQEVQSLEKEFSDEMNQDDAELNAGVHGGLEKETDIAINEVEDYVVMPTDDSSKASREQADKYSAEQHGIEHEALVAMREHALKEAEAVSGVQSAMWNESLLPDLQLDVVANVTPESAIPLMNTLCTSLSDNTVQPATVSIKDLEGGHIARQMCGALVQGVD